MRAAILVLALSLFSTASLANPLAGTWKSDRELTLKRLEIDKVPAVHQKTIIEEGDLGNAVVQFLDREYIWTLGQRERILPYKILAINGNYVDIQYFQHRTQSSPKRARVFVTPTLLYMPIGEFNFYEVFRRISPPAKGVR